jgi:hypothetical protein
MVTTDIQVVHVLVEVELKWADIKCFQIFLTNLEYQI